MYFILQIIGQNFLCFPQLSLWLMDLGLLSLSGVNHLSTSQNNNGAGKSALFEAIYFTIYGKMLRDVLSKEIPLRESILERTGQTTKGTYTIISFVDAQTNKIFQIERYHYHPKLKNELFLFQYNDPDVSQLTEEPLALMQEPQLLAKDLRGADKAETQQKINKLIGLSADMFRQVTLFGEGGMPRFSKLSDTAKKQLLEEILQVHIYTKAEQIAKDRRKEAKEDLRVLSNKRVQKTNIAEQTRSRIIDLVQRQDKWSRDQVSKVESLKRQIKTLQTTKKPAPLYVAEETIEDHRKQHESLRKEYENDTTLTKRLADIQKKQQSTDQKYSKQAVELEHIQEEIARIENLLEKGQCPTCSQPVTEVVLPDTAELKYTQDTLNLEQMRLWDVCQDLASDKVKTESRMKEARDIFFADQSRLESQIESLCQAKIKYDQWSFKEVHKDQEIQNLEERMQQVQDDPSPYTDLIKADQNKLQGQTEEAEIAKREQDELQLTIKKLDVMVNVFGTKGIRSFLLENLLPEVNERLLEYAEIMTGGELTAQLSIQSETAKGEKREKISIAVRTITGEEVRYESCSSGERRRLDVPLALALQDLSLSRGRGLGLSLLDEVFENIDEAGVDNMMELLHVVSKRKGIGTTIVVTHNEQLNQRFNRGIVVERDVNGVSQCFDT